jgi:hypothetical protein
MEGRAVGHNFERDPPKGHPCQVWFNLVQRFSRKDLNVIFYQNMPNLHNRYKSASEKFHRKAHFSNMWLHHVPFTICVVSVLKIAFCDKKKRALPFFISIYYFFSSILRFLTKRGRQVCH